MHNRRPSEPDAEILSESVASRLLTRASELDAAQRAGAAVAQLRAAATEAGISASAFDAALSELHGADGQAPDMSRKPRRRSRMRAFLAGVTALIAVGALAVMRSPSGAVAPTVEEAFLLRCLTPGQAAELIRPLLGLPTNRIVYSPTRTPRVLTVRATPVQIQDVRSLLDKYESGGPAACAARPAPAETPKGT